MKWMTGIAVATAVVAWTYLTLDLTRSPSDPPGSGIRIVSGIDRPMAMPPAPRPGMIVPTTMLAPSRPPEETTVARTDTEALADLFDTQIRDAAWAPGAEAEVRSHMPAGGDVRCAAFMCRIAMPLPDRSMSMSADRQADAASRRWSTDLSYNHLTATIVGDRQVPTLIFYVTRSAGGSEVM